MMIRRFFLKDKVCATCGRKLPNEELVLRANDSGKCYCENCRDSLLDAEEEGKASKYTTYLASKGVAHLAIVYPSDFNELEEGVHALTYFEDHGVAVFAYDKRCHGDAVGDFAKSIFFDFGFILEKNSDFSCLFFARNYIEDVESTINDQFDVKIFVDRFCRWTGTDEADVNLLINEYNDVAGIMTGGKTADESLVVKEYYEGEITAKSVNNAVEEYDENAEAGEEKTENMNDNANENRTDISKRVEEILNDLTPIKMLEFCQDRICGQGIQLKKAVYLVYSYLQSVASGKPFQAENWILTSPSGTGKTEFYRAVKDIFRMYKIPVPVVQIDLSQITETGFKGADAASIPARIASENIAARGVGICFLDEADKKFVPSYGSKGVDYNAATQSNLLTLLEGIEQKVEVNEREIPFDSSKTMFVLLGSFQKLRDEKQNKSMAKGRIGFGDDYGGKTEKTVAEDAMYADLEMDDMIEFGMQEELAGRVTYVVNFHKLSEDDMRNLIRKKSLEISESLNVKIYISDEAVEDFLKISFGNLGVRAPMNQIKKLVQEEIAEVFFESGFDAGKQRIVIDSKDKAHVENVSDAVKDGIERFFEFKRKIERE